MKHSTNSIALAFVFACMGLFLSGCESLSSALPSLSNPFKTEPATELSDALLKEMVQDFDANYIAANKKWAGKKYVITGKTTLISESDPSLGPSGLLGGFRNGGYDIHIEPHQPSGLFSNDTHRVGFFVHVDASSKKAVELLKKGDIIIATGTLEKAPDEPSLIVSTNFFLSSGSFSKIVE